VITVKNKSIGDGCPTFVVAEMAWAHDGSVDKGKAIIDGAAAAGADAINLHFTNIADYMVPYYGAGPGRVSGGREVLQVYRYLDDINLSNDAFHELVEHARKAGLLVSAMCNDLKSLDFARDLAKPDILMIHPSSVSEEKLLRGIAATGKPFVIYVGGLTLGEIETAVRLSFDEGNKNVILQHGFQSYPTALEENNLNYIPTLKAMFGQPVAFGDHTDGADPMAHIVPLIAIAKGANVIEKHITYDRAEKGEDYESALDPKGFKVFVEQLRKAELTLGLSRWRPLSEREVKYRGVVRKRAVAKMPIPAGSVIDMQHVAFKRVDEGFFPDEFTNLVGHVRAKMNIEENMAITWNNVE
jgi:sialic acid synthase SpsE